MVSLLFFLVVLTFVDAFPKSSELVDITVVHMNDMHARFDETNDLGGDCKSADCIGGFSRLYEQVNEIRSKNPNIILLNAGDNFQGTLWYTVYKWNVTQYFLNKLNLDAITLGNHEFDDGIDGIVPFIKAMNAPVVIANIDASLEPRIQGTFTKSIVVERNGKKIGIIGVLTSTTAQISNPEKLIFLNESASINAEAERLVREEGVFTNIILSHCGYDVDQELAKNASEKIGLIIGGHSHTFLYTGENPPGPDQVMGDYPTIVTRKDGKKVLVTQAAEYNKYFGNITVTFDEFGEIVDWFGAPIFLDTNLQKNEDIDEELAPWKEEIDKIGTKVIGSTLVDLSNQDCYIKECLLGNFVADAYVYSFIDKAPPGSWTYASIAIMNPGGLRTTIPRGNITYSDLLTAQPFGNTVDVSDIKGKYILEVLEATSTEYNYGHIYASVKILQVSGIKYVLDLTKPEGSRIQSVKIRCSECDVPHYEDLDLEKTYRIITPSYLTTAGDQYTGLQHLENTVIGDIDVDVFTHYLSEKSPVYKEIEGRVEIIGEELIVSKNTQ